MTEDPAPLRIVCGVSCQVDEEKDRITIAETDRHTTEQAIDLAARSGGTVVFVHVVDWLSGRAAEDGEAVAEEVREALAPDFAEISAKAEARNVGHRHEMRLGKPWKGLVEVAEAEQADVLAVSPRRRWKSLGQRIFHGSTTSRVLKEALCPVWVVEPECGAPKRVLALLDLTPVSPRVVEASRRLARLYGAELYALSCLDYPDDISLQRLPRAREAIARYHREVRTRARDEMAELTAGEDDWQLLLGEDWVVRLAPRVIEDKKIDLVVMAAVSKPRLAGTLLGTTAQRLLDHVSVSTWVVHPEGDPA